MTNQRLASDLAFIDGPASDLQVKHLQRQPSDNAPIDPLRHFQEAATATGPPGNEKPAGVANLDGPKTDAKHSLFSIAAESAPRKSNPADLEFLASCVPGNNISAVLAEIPDARPNGARPLNAASMVRKFRPRRYQCSPDREESRMRRRMLARDGHMPPDVRTKYTEGEAAALIVIAGEVKRQGVCDLPIDKIAALAGVCRTTAQNAMREAERLGHIAVERRPVRGRRSETNIVRIVSREWLAWLKRGPGTGFKILKFVNPTKTVDSKLRGFPDMNRMRRASG